MAKDDYPVIVAKILIFLYKRLKGRTNENPTDYIVENTKDFPIDLDYLRYVIEHLEEDGYVENVLIAKAWGGEFVKFNYSEMRITPAGIYYLRENSTIKKVATALKEAASIMSLFSN